MLYYEMWSVNYEAEKSIVCDFFNNDFPSHYVVYGGHLSDRAV